MAFEPFLQLLRGMQGKRGQNGIGAIQNGQQIAYLRHLQKEKRKEDTLNTPLAQLKVTVFDLETTGYFPHKGDVILSIGAVQMCGKKIMQDRQFYSLVQYDGLIPKEIEHLTGIIKQDVVDAPPLSEVLLGFFEFLEDTTLVAHHSGHERAFMQHASSTVLNTPFTMRIVDTSFLYKIVDAGLTNGSLEQLCRYNKIPVAGRHHALNDAIMTAKLWSAYIEKVRSAGCETLQDVYELYARI